MARTDADTVKGILAPGNDYDLVRNHSLTPAITWANVVTNQLAEKATEAGTTISSDVLTVIESWLAAHAYKLSDKAYTFKGSGAAQASFDGKTGMGLESTLYGQAAMFADGTGILANMNKGRKRAAGFWAGRVVREQTDYDDRNY